MLLALLLLLAATTAALEQDGKDYDLYTTASALRNLAGGFASEVEVTADGRVKKLIFDGTADLLAEARALVNALGVTQGEGCEDRDCAAKELVNMMRGTVDARRRTAGEALDLAGRGLGRVEAAIAALSQQTAVSLSAKADLEAVSAALSSKAPTSTHALSCHMPA